MSHAMPIRTVCGMYIHRADVSSVQHISLDRSGLPEWSYSLETLCQTYLTCDGVSRYAGISRHVPPYIRRFAISQMCIDTKESGRHVDWTYSKYECGWILIMATFGSSGELLVYGCIPILLTTGRCLIHSLSIQMIRKRRKTSNIDWTNLCI